MWRWLHGSKCASLGRLPFSCSASLAVWLHLLVHKMSRAQRRAKCFFAAWQRGVMLATEHLQQVKALFGT